MSACCQPTSPRRTVVTNAGCCGPGQEGSPGIDGFAGFEREFWRLLGALLFAGWGMVLSLGVNDASSQGELPFGSPMYNLLHGGLLISTLGVIGLIGGPLLSAFARSVFQRRIQVEALFAISVVGALVASVLSTLTGEGAVFYEVVGITLLIYRVGSLIGERSRAAAHAAVDSLREAYSTAGLMTNDASAVRRVPVAELSVGDRVLVGPGEGIPVDGTIVGGGGFVRETALTGEPLAVNRLPGDTVFAGSDSVDGRFEIAVGCRAGERRIDTVLAAVDDAKLAPSRLQLEADRIAGWFVPVVASVSLGTFLVWSLFGPWAQALFHSMAVLLIACPCALGLATPIAVFSGLYRFSRLGIISRSADLIESLASCDVVVFDKTGTLSMERPEITGVHFDDNSSSGDAFVLSAIRSVEQANPHPVARALATLKVPEAAPVVRVESVRQHAGLGVEATVSKPCGCRVDVKIGSGAMLGRRAGTDRGTVFFDVGGTTGRIELEEKLREGLSGTMQELRGLGISPRILTGDSAPRWSEIGGVTLETGLTPDQKAEAVRSLESTGRCTVFVGDGINDASAMALASAAIAMGAGADLARSTSTAVLVGDSFSTLPTAIRVARRIRAAIGGNLRFAICYNALGMGIAALGWLHPVAAAMIMVISSVLVSVRAVRSTRVVVE